MRFSSENWSSCPLDEISVADITEVIHKKALSAPFAARRLRINLSSVFVEAQRAGVLPPGHNPALVSVHPIARVETERLLLSEWLSVFRVAKYAAPDYFEIAMLLALVTAQRPSDLVRMHSDHIYDGLLHVVQFKTGERIALPTALRLDETGTSIQDVIDICPAGYLLQNSRGQPVNTWSLSRWFRICREQAGITSTAGKPPPFKEQRSLSERLYRAQGIDTRTLLGHKYQKMTDGYNDIRGKEFRRLSI